MRTLTPWTLAVALAASFAAAASALAAPSTEMRVGGLVQRPATLDLAALQARPALTQTDTFLAGATPQTHDFTGASMWSLLNDAGLVLDPAVRNDVLNQLVVATGSDGYRVVYSLGELSPMFGNRQALVAYAETIGGTSRGLGADGFARTTAPGDLRGGRYVSNLVSLDVQRSQSTTPSVGGGTSAQLRISGDVVRPGTFDLAALQALPQTSVAAGANLFGGVSFWDLLNTTAGLLIDPSVKNDVLGMYVVAVGSDGYKSVFSLGELSPLFGNAPDLIALSVDGQPLGGNGFARVVVPGDVARGRFVSNLVGLEVYHAAAAVPEPSTLALLAIGLIGTVSVRRRRSAGYGAPGRSRATSAR